MGAETEQHRMIYMYGNWEKVSSGKRMMRQMGSVSVVWQEDEMNGKGKS
jgi:hypothetical protein